MTRRAVEGVCRRQRRGVCGAQGSGGSTGNTQRRGGRGGLQVVTEGPQAICRALEGFYRQRRGVRSVQGGKGGMQATCRAMEGSEGGLQEAAREEMRVRQVLFDKISDRRGQQVHPPPLFVSSGRGKRERSKQSFITHQPHAPLITSSTNVDTVGGFNISKTTKSYN